MEEALRSQEWPTEARKIGYARVSTGEQNLDMQIAVLTADGVLKGATMPQPPPWGSPNDNAIGKRAGYRRVLRSLEALDALRDIEADLREQASGSQDGYLLDVANRMRAALSKFQT